MNNEFLPEAGDVARTRTIEGTTDEHTGTVDEVIGTRDSQETARGQEEAATRTDGHAGCTLERERVEDRATRQRRRVSRENGVGAVERVGRDLEARRLQVGYELRAHAWDGPEGITARDVVLGDKEADARPCAGVIRHNPGHDLRVRDTTAAKVAACLADLAPE